MLIKIKNNRQEIERVCEEIKNFCREQEINDGKYHDIVLIVDEVISNVINYAYPDQQEHEFSLEMMKHNERVYIRIIDGGIPFDPLTKNDPDTLSDLEERQVGGLGIFLVRQLSDYVEYSRVDDKNHLSIIVKLLSTTI